jgi:hypothetical protein
MKTAAAIIGILALLGGPVQAQPAAQPLLELHAKVVSWGMVMPIPPVARVVLGTLSKPQLLQLDDCLKRQRLQPRDYRALMLAWAYPTPGHRLHVVRASPKYCGVFYGDRDFAYYLVDERRGGGPPSFNLVFANRGDRMAILPKVTNGLNEIEAAGCNDGGCRIARMAYDGRRYRPVQCEETVVRGKSEVRRARRCGSDSFPDDQAPPPATRPRR